MCSAWAADVCSSASSCAPNPHTGFDGCTAATWGAAGDSTGNWDDDNAGRWVNCGWGRSSWNSPSGPTDFGGAGTNSKTRGWVASPSWSNAWAETPSWGGAGWNGGGRSWATSASYTKDWSAGGSSDWSGATSGWGASIERESSSCLGPLGRAATGDESCSTPASIGQQTSSLGGSEKCTVDSTTATTVSARRELISGAELLRDEAAAAAARSKHSESESAAPASGEVEYEIIFVGGQLIKVPKKKPVEKGQAGGATRQDDRAKVHVSGLSYDTAEDALRQHFGRVGEVVYVSIFTDRETGRSRGSAKVDFGEEALAKRAIAELHHSELDGRKITVQALGSSIGAAPRGRGSGGRASANTWSSKSGSGPASVSRAGPVPCGAMSGRFGSSGNVGR